MTSFIDRLLGLHASVDALTWGQFAARTVVVFLLGILLVRVADRRFLGRNAGFDVLLAIVLGSVLSRGINGQAPFLPTLGASVLLVFLHRLVGALACRWSAFSKLIKGDAIVLVKDGVRRPDAMRRADISEDDLEENLRVNANVAKAEDVAEARLERNGLISAVKRGRS
jgi:uncharacterized membrane protein YcaP (DUF421 family)